METTSQLSHLETLPAELLILILEELHSNSIIGVRAFACVSRRCRTLASEYSHKPLRVNFTESELSDPLPFTVLLSAIQNFKTLKIHSELYIADDDGERELEYISIEAALNANSFDCIEFLLERTRDWPYLYPMYGVIDLFHRRCPMLSKMVIDLGEFYGYSPGWDRVFREDIRQELSRCQLPTRIPTIRLEISMFAQFAHLRYLKVHFLIAPLQLQLMHPRQGRQAAVDLYKVIERQKDGVRLDRLDVVFYTWACNIYGFIGSDSDTKVVLTITIRPLEKIKGERRYSVMCDNPRFGKLLERRKKAEKLYGSSAWVYRLGPHVWGCEHGWYSKPVAMLSETVVRIALWPVVFKKDKDKRKVKWPFDVDTREYR